MRRAVISALRRLFSRCADRLSRSTERASELSTGDRSISRRIKVQFRNYMPCGVHKLGPASRTGRFAGETELLNPTRDCQARRPSLPCDARTSCVPDKAFALDTQVRSDECPRPTAIIARHGVAFRQWVTARHYDTSGATTASRGPALDGIDSKPTSARSPRWRCWMSRDSDRAVVERPLVMSTVEVLDVSNRADEHVHIVVS